MNFLSRTIPDKDFLKETGWSQKGIVENYPQKYKLNNINRTDEKEIVSIFEKSDTFEAHIICLFEMISNYNL